MEFKKVIDAISAKEVIEEIVGEKVYLIALQDGEKLYVGGTKKVFIISANKESQDHLELETYTSRGNYDAGLKEKSLIVHSNHFLSFARAYPKREILDEMWGKKTAAVDYFGSKKDISLLNPLLEDGVKIRFFDTTSIILSEYKLASLLKSWVAEKGYTVLMASGEHYSTSSVFDANGNELMNALVNRKEYRVAYMAVNVIWDKFLLGEKK